MANIWVIHLYSLPVFLIIILILTIINILTLKKMKGYPPASALPYVSILIPARNEEENIDGCIISLLEQAYPHKEIIVLNDQSTDQTLERLFKIQNKYPELKIMDGKPLPKGWLGKNWACHQLFIASHGDVILFTDADTHHQKTMLIDAISTLLHEKADMLTALVRLDINSFGEGLIVPFMYWSLLTFFPLSFSSFFKIKDLSASVGQLMMFKRDAFLQIGGYEAIKDNIVDDFQLGRNILQHKLQLHLSDASEEVSCRMYSNLCNAINGFKKNFFPLFNFNIPLFLFVFLYLLLVYIEPLLVLIIKVLFSSFDFVSWLPLVLCIFFTILQQSLVYWRIRIPVYFSLFYPLNILIAVYTAFRSLVGYVTKSVKWKDRPVE